MSSFEIYPPFQPKDASSAAQPYKTVVYATEQEAIDTVARAGAAHWGWNKTPLVVR